MRFFTFLVVSSFLLACGDDDASDAGNPDTGAADVRVVDTGAQDALATPDALSDPPDAVSVDAGPNEDVGPSEDAGSDTGPDMDAGGPDAGTDAGPAGPCDGLDIGGACPCAEPYQCVEGRCVVGGGRPTCGGFVGALCDTAEFPACTYFPGADFGPCLSAAERTCVCAEHRDQYSCF